MLKCAKKIKIQKVPKRSKKIEKAFWIILGRVAPLDPACLFDTALAEEIRVDDEVRGGNVQAMH